jgi:hypothetical protein
MLKINTKIIDDIHKKIQPVGDCPMALPFALKKPQ